MNKQNILKLLPYIAIGLASYLLYAYISSKNTTTPVTESESQIDNLVANPVVDGEDTSVTDAVVEPTEADLSNIQSNVQQQALIADYTAKIKANNNDADAYYRRAVIYQNTQKYSMAISDYTEALRIAPTSANAYFNRATVQAARKDFVSAIEDFNDAIKLIADDPIMYNARGVAYISKGELDKAVEDFKKSIALDPKYNRAYFNLATVYDKQLAYKDAIAQYDNAILNHAKDESDANDQAALNRLLNIYYHRALVKLQLADYAAALTDINFFLDQDTKSAKAYRLRAAIYTRMGNTAGAAQDESSAQNVGFEEMLD